MFYLSSPFKIKKPQFDQRAALKTKKPQAPPGACGSSMLITNQ
jgi:hypothetical protein